MAHTPTRITRTVAPNELGNLLTSAGSAVVAWNRDGRVAAETAAFRYEEGVYFIGLPEATLSEGTEVAVLVDDGEMYFDLRGVRARGRASATREDQGDGLEWFAVRPERVVAWSYGALRER